MSFSLIAAFNLTGAAVFTLAFFKGSPAERWGAALVGMTWGSEFVSHLFFGASAFSLAFVPIFGLCADMALACGFLWLALRYSSLWLAAAMMLQAMQLALYGSFLASRGGHHNEYAIASNIESGLLLLTILGATLGSWRRRVVERRGAAEPARPAWA